MANTFCLALGQAPADLSTTKDRLDWLRERLPDVAARGADLLLLPELFASGYHIGDALQHLAETAQGPVAQSMATLASTHKVAIHYGFPERLGDKLFNAAQCFGPDGHRLGGHRKLMMPPGFERDCFAPGKGCELFDYRQLRIATLICYDAEFPETVRHVAALGAQLVLVPTALGAQWAWVAQTMMPTRAFENGVYLAYANSAGSENGLTFLGQSFIAAPDGRELARAGSEAEILYASLDAAKVTAAQSRLPYLTDRKTFEMDMPAGKS